MALGRRSGSSGDSHAVLYRAVSLLVGYPDDDLVAQLDEIEAALVHMTPAARERIGGFLRHVREHDLTETQSHYVEIFDMRRKCCLFLTYYAYGDTRKRGMALLTFKSAYRKGGVVMNSSELPDHLAVVLQFAGTVDEEIGRKLMMDHRAGLELIALALAEAKSFYAPIIRAVIDTLPALQGNDEEALQRLIAQGPPAEEVGLEPFAAPDLMGARR